MSDSLQPYGLYSARFLCPWDFPGKNIGVGRHSLLSRGSPWPRDQTEPPASTGRFFTIWITREAQKMHCTRNTLVFIIVETHFHPWNQLVHGFKWFLLGGYYFCFIVEETKVQRGWSNFKSQWWCHHCSRSPYDSALLWFFGLLHPVFLM